MIPIRNWARLAALVLAAGALSSRTSEVAPAEKNKFIDRQISVIARKKMPAPGPTSQTRADQAALYRAGQSLCRRKQE